MATNNAIAVATSDAVEGMSFCSIWPIAKGLLTGVQAGISNPTLKTAIAALIAAADAVCSGSAADVAGGDAGSGERLAKFGLSVPPAEQSFVAGLSDNELQVLAAIQREAAARGLSKGVGGCIF
ncbi:hypothetical protein IV454_24395 [Massilia antarctica]|uniref:Uncharacterized protein n=1 Tax=Massilia antarctica TaxID=2765360 RepID=A0AA48WA10_9BURK|nr:hypothetical protein [Massilia antarctica]QPI48638.1 hypothetical protein IV454_24395 [Massilia antarctica]